MAGNTKNIAVSPKVLNQEYYSNNESLSNTSVCIHEQDLMNHYQFVKLCRIDLSKDDVNNLENDGRDMEIIFFIVNNGTEDNT